MHGNNVKKYVIFGLIAGLVLIILGKEYVSPIKTPAALTEETSPYPKDTSAPSNESSTLDRIISKFKNTDVSVKNIPNDNAIVNEHCGISFDIPEGWVIEEVKEGERYCDYRIDNPFKRGATLNIGVPNTVNNLSPHEWNEVVLWEDIVEQYLTEEVTYTPVTVGGAEGFLIDLAIYQPKSEGELVGVGDPKYVFRKGSAVYYIRYGYYPQTDYMVDDISSVVTSFTFTRESSFYDTPMHSEPTR